jgi:hypothetical protein
MMMAESSTFWVARAMASWKAASSGENFSTSPTAAGIWAVIRFRHSMSVSLRCRAASAAACSSRLAYLEDLGRRHLLRGQAMAHQVGEGRLRQSQYDGRLAAGDRNQAASHQGIGGFAYGGAAHAQDARQFAFAGQALSWLQAMLGDIAHDVIGDLVRHPGRLERPQW